MCMILGLLFWWVFLLVFLLVWVVLMGCIKKNEVVMMVLCVV